MGSRCLRLALLVPLLASASVHAQRAAPQYPSQDIRFVVPFPPGGGNDVVGRIVAKHLQQVLGREVIVENRGAEGGTHGTALVAKASPDGHTMLINNISLAVNATLFPKLPYDLRRDLAPVSIVARQPSVLIVSPSLPVKSVAELLELARRKPGTLIYGSGGPGSSSHLATERLLMAAGARMTHVPYKGLAQAVADASAGKVDMVMATASTVLPAMTAGKVRALAVSTARRSGLFPQLPTLEEAGVAGFEASTWYALLVPARTPGPIVSRLNAELGRMAAPGAAKDELAMQGLESEHTTATQAREYIRAEIARWAKVVKVSGAKPG